MAARDGAGRWTWGGGVVLRNSTLDASNIITMPSYSVTSLMVSYATHWTGSNHNFRLVQRIALADGIHAVP